MCQCQGCVWGGGGWHLWGPEVCTTTVAGQVFTSRFFKTIPVLVGTMRYWPTVAGVLMCVIEVLMC